ncbi:hypothetical protein MLD38_031640 [Melastoma candidum]|uniref:Uncharacterized protein n=1 Tax=Melastoma candidum TaxID=119954 RepID=A0ACB9MS56_9MYRT|nr:hypothetical protein MLD38_031640 [Melastoma candidum]
MESHDRKMPEVVMLNSGHKMPIIALGTGGILPPHGVLTSILVDAMEVGYRHFDTAFLYGSESPLGAAIREALHRGIIASRDELFITTKLWCTDAHPPLVLPAMRKSLETLGLEYVDLYLIHWPVRVVHGTEGFFHYKGKMLPFDIKGTWAAMEECSRLGLAKSIGVSNFGSRKLLQILDSCTVPPAVNQVEMNVAWQQTKLREFCKGKGIHVSAWSPLGGNGAPWGSLAVMQSPVLKEIADARGSTVPQVALKWVHEQGAVVIVKSFNKERMKENLKIFEWKMTEYELEKIKGIPQRRGYPGEWFIDADNGPYKSAEELFDEDS